MRPRLRSSSGPTAAREGRPLELVRVRRTQRNPGPEGRNLRRRPRRRGGRGRGPRAPGHAPFGFSFWQWLRGLFSGDAPASGARVVRVALADQESRIISEFNHHYGLTFQEPRLLKLALTHRSYLHVSGQGPRESNERLEFLGDSVLGLVTSEYLYRANPTEHEGQLTKTKSLLVSKAILSRRALAMGLGRFVLMSHSEVESGGRQRLSILADAFESVVGAIYLDQGFEASRTFIERWLLRESRTIAADKRHTNYKSHLQEYVQSTFRTHPVYRIRSEMGPDHSKQFNVEVMVGRRVLGEGKGRNKKEAEQAAARDALERVESPVDSEPRPRRRERDDEPVRATSGISEPVLAPRPERAVDRTMPAEESEEREPRRRRGRRGGRGRRARADGFAAEVTPEVAPEPAPESAVPEKAPARGGTRPASPVREVVKPAVRALPFLKRAEESERLPRPIEFEPPPARHEEDENEEVGRPEGPLEERHVDPYAWETVAPAEPPAFESGGEEEESRSAAPVTQDEPEDVETPEAPSRPAVRERTWEQDRRERGVRPDRGSRSERSLAPEPEATAPTPPPTPPPAPSSPAFGRKQRRGSPRG
ncbi:MAG TPA: ribonuclease III [Candidatus Limnocylindria bacterium]|nr:ribonuclease III [Candidatus Limnocylindria bacterium]